MKILKKVIGVKNTVEMMTFIENYQDNLSWKK